MKPIFIIVTDFITDDEMNGTQQIEFICRTENGLYTLTTGRLEQFWDAGFKKISQVIKHHFPNMYNTKCRSENQTITLC